LRRAILHLGFPKAGSSSIQATFYKNRRRLDAAGLRYGAFTEYGRGVRSHSSAFVNLFGDRPERYHANLKAGKTADQQRAKFAREMAENLAGTGPVVFSGEDISTLSEAGLARMAAHFAEAGWTLRPILIVRPPEAFLHSFAQTLIRQGATRLLPAGKLADRFSNRIVAIRAALPQTEIYPFQAAVDHPAGPPGFLADLIQPGLAERLAPERSNESVSAHAAALILHVNRLLPMYVETPERRISPLRQARDLHPLFAVPGARFRLPAERIDRLRPEIAAENAWLAQHLGPEFCDPPGDVADAPLVWGADQAAAVPPILRRLAPHLAAAAASYFEDSGGADLPPRLAALPARYRAGGTLWQRYKRGGPGMALADRLYRRYLARAR